MINALTVDVEDYFHVSAFSSVISTNDWDNYESRVERNTHQLLDLFAKHEVCGTFFILGWVAERYPKLVREIAASGHEVACHGYSHQLIYNQNKDTFRNETIKAKKILEDITQTEINRYGRSIFSQKPGSAMTQVYFQSDMIAMESREPNPFLIF